LRGVLENVGTGDKDPDWVIGLGRTRRMRRKLNQITFTETSGGGGVT
jgi:hypothetical protein